MNFAALPPELNSALMYTGPGAGPILAAAAAWNSLAAELHSTAAGCESVVTSLTTDGWLGPSSAAMTAAITPYVEWLTATAAAAEQTAAQSTAAAAAYDTAFAMTVPPPVIAANRAQVMLLVATNIFGQNSGAIAALEALYGEMWVQDATAMYGYAGSAAAALELSPFTPPLTTANPAAATGTGGAEALTQLASAAPQALQAVAAPAAAEAVLPPLAVALIQLESIAGPPLAASSLAVGSSAWNSAAGNSRTLIANSEAILNNGSELLKEQEELSVMQLEMRELLKGQGVTSGLSSSVGSGLGQVSASMARAVGVGGLSVPTNWAVAAPEFRAAAYALPATAAAAAPAALTGASGAFGQMALAGMAGSALSGTVNGARPGVGVAPTAKLRKTPPQPLVSSPVTEMASGLRELAALRDAGILTEEEFAEQKRRLLDP